MCGISGIISNNSIHIDFFVKMNQIINHRGPDDEGFVLFNDNDFVVLGSGDTAKESWSSNELYSPKSDINSSTFQAHVAFGHRRLSILDLSPKGHQPMCTDDQRFWITFNGEIYNYLEIKQELKGYGYTFYTNTDTEVILQAFIHWGQDCQNKFNGMWAFAIYDTKEENLFLSRDRYGIKPLYYWFNFDGDFYFGSEIKQFTVQPGWKAVLNGARAFDYLYFGLTDHTEETLFTGVNMILPGHCFSGPIVHLNSSHKKGKLAQVKWYNPSINNFKGSFEEAKEQFLNRFKDSVKLHLRADVPVGSALSGGLDSSSIVSYVNILLREQSKEQLQKTFSSCSEDPRFDERNWVEEVVKETEVDGHFVYPKGEDVFKLTEKLIWHMDEPYQSQSAFLGYHVFQEAKVKGVLVLLNGQGADEYLSGYADFRLHRQKKLLKQLRFIEVLKEVSGFYGLINLSVLFSQDLLPSPFRNFLALRNSRQKLYDTIFEWKKLIGKKVHPYQINDYSKNSHIIISEYQLFKEPLQKYLRWEDRNSMAHSVEARVPFLDHRLVEFTRSLPIEFLDGPGQTKKILVKAMEGILPEKVRMRKDKKGFITPEEKWFKENYSQEFLQMFEKYAPYSNGIVNIEKTEQFLKDVQQGKIQFDYTYWRIILFCVWMKVFKVEVAA